MTAPWNWRDVKRTVTESVGVGATRVTYVTHQVPKESSKSSGAKRSGAGSRRSRRRKRGRRRRGSGVAGGGVDD